MAQRPVRDPLDDDTEHADGDGRHSEDDEEERDQAERAAHEELPRGLEEGHEGQRVADQLDGGGVGEKQQHAEADVGADHEHLGVGEVDHEQDAVDERVPERHERVHAAEGHPVDQLLDDYVE